MWCAVCRARQGFAWATSPAVDGAACALLRSPDPQGVDGRSPAPRGLGSVAILRHQARASLSLREQGAPVNDGLAPERCSCTGFTCQRTRGLTRGRPDRPLALPEADGAPQRYDDFTKRLTAAAADAKRNRASSYRIGSRAFLLLLAGVATLLVGFGAMTAVLGLGAWLAHSDAKPASTDTKPVPTTAAPVAPPSSAAPAVTAPPSSAARGAAVQSDLPPPTPEQAPVSAPPAPAPPPLSAPNLNPAGHAPPGRNK
jgi:hypothetical protein